MLIALFGVGAGLGLVFLWRLHADPVRVVRYGLGAQGVVIAVMSLAPTTGFAFLGAALFGAATSTTLTASMSAVQELLPDEQRVVGFAAFHILIRAGLSLSAIGAGIATDLIRGVHWPVVGHLPPSRVVLLGSGLFVAFAAALIAPLLRSERFVAPAAPSVAAPDGPPARASVFSPAVPVDHEPGDERRPARTRTGPLPMSRLTIMGATTAAAANASSRPPSRPSNGTTATSAARLPIAVSPANRPRTMPARRVTVPGHAWASSAPSVGEIPRPPAPRSHGDQLCPTTAAPPAIAATSGRRRVASSGPTAPLATSRTPAAASGPNPATRYKPVPETVPLPTSRRSTPCDQRAARFENGIEPARKPAPTTTTAGQESREGLARYPPGRGASAPVRGGGKDGR